MREALCTRSRHRARSTTARSAACSSSVVRRRRITSGLQAGSPAVRALP
nr:MAG TPA: hypothetical protein [Caudoviricetes sp.]